MKKYLTGFMVATMLVLTSGAWAAPYIGANADVSHGNTQAVIGVASLIGPFGVEGTHLTNQVLPTKLTTCGYEKYESKTCATNETGGIKNTVALTATLPFTDKLSGVAKVGAGNGSKTYFASVGASYEAVPHLHLNADIVGYQRSGDRDYVPTIGATFSF